MSTTGLVPDGESLAGTYATTRSMLCDTENTLFTNPGAAAFPTDTGAIRWELDPSDPPTPPEPVADGGDGLHYYRYERTQALHVWERDLPLARWSRVQRRLADDGAARPMWLALRQALVRGEVSIREWNIPQGTRFGLRIEIHAPSTGPRPRSAVAASEPLVDGALSALHAGAPLPEAVMVAELLAPKLGIPPERLLELVEDRVALFRGSPFVVGNGYLQFSPCDELCVAGEVQIITDPTIAVVETSGELFTVSLQEAADSGQAVGDGLLGYLDTHLARDIALAEAANEWTASLPADHVVDAEHVIRTARSDGPT